MSEVNQLAKRSREPLLNGKWVSNTNLKEQLSDISFTQAAAKLPHSIAQKDSTFQS